MQAQQQRRRVVGSNCLWAARRPECPLTRRPECGESIAQIDRVDERLRSQQHASASGYASAAAWIKPPHREGISQVAEEPPPESCCCRRQRWMRVSRGGRHARGLSGRAQAAAARRGDGARTQTTGARYRRRCDHTERGQRLVRLLRRRLRLYVCDAIGRRLVRLR